MKPGDSVTFKRDPNYWGRDLPINRGSWNFDTIRFDYYRDGNTHFEAFKRGLYDVRAETDPGRWQTAYDFPALREGRVVKESFPYGLPKGMQGLVMNTRRPMFADARVREAILQLFDFEWINRNYFFNLYERTASYFDACILSAHGVPASARERELLSAFPGVVRPDIMEGTWSPPKTDGSGRNRASLRRAFALFRAAGYEIKGTALTHVASGRPFAFEILTTTRDQERLALAYSRMLKRAGINAVVRNVDATQFERRQISFDFDMMEYRWEQSLSPGNEQLFYWGSAAADQQGSRNYMGVKSKAIDAMIAALLRALSEEDFVSAIRALDRVLLSGFYVVPLYYLPVQWVARWTRIKHPTHTSLFGYLPETWWQRGRRHDPRRKTPIPAATAPRSTSCSAVPACATRTASRWSIRPTGKASPTARRAASPSRRPTGPSRPWPRACAGSACATDAVVAIQLPNTVEAVIALLGVLRAGMIAAPLPLLWREQDIVAALAPIGAKAIVTAGRIGAHRARRDAMQAAVELFPIRYVCAFGRDLPDGVVPLDDVFAAIRRRIAPHAARPGPAAAHVAVVSFEVTTAGIVPVARNHTATDCRRTMAFLEAGMAPEAPLLSADPARFVCQASR